MIYRFFNIVIISLGLLLVYFMSMFWIGSKEQFDVLRKTFFIFFANRFLLCLFGMIITLFFVFILNKLFGVKKELKKELLINFTVLTVFSILVILYLYFKP